ncbi:MAG TPA: nucleotidyltransferase domain-containing protein [Baekduia sp.]|uniref:nucleotidyltransferase domain-containing protein n=1 Tax=Baekduia sp. TaxID=2600305 RepID=UPI002D783D20|nr:nucleotidyltransferase domain-containing protein [Baekduia sp.]HET6506791.1 nucleotidyltransferase domain-containing protein [Baekduia sp.]
MDVAHPYRAVIPSLDGDVLVALAGTTRPLTGRQLAALAPRGSQRAVATVLDRLVDQGLVHREHAGRAYLHTLNRDHLAAPSVEALAGLRTELLTRIRTVAAAWTIPPVALAMFGSTARGDGDSASDIDLLVVRPAGTSATDEGWHGQIGDLRDGVHRWTGNHAAVIDLAEEEIPALIRDERPVVAEIRRDAIDLVGSPVRSLLRA